MRSFGFKRAIMIFIVFALVIQSMSLSIITFAEPNGIAAVSETESDLKAYPGAEGFGQVSKGGRGGQVYHVTNLEASGEGSLTYGLEQLSGARTIVFDVGGVIDLTDLGRAIQLKNEGGSYVTVAGQSAPYPGITIKGYGLDIEGAHDTVIRNIRVRIGDVRADGETYIADPLYIKASKRIIVDHCSMQWGVDKGFEITGEDITLSNNIFDKQLTSNSFHEKGGHAYAGMINEGARRITFAKNFIGDSTQRSPRITDADRVDSYNCLLYNCGNGYDMYNYEWKNKNVRMNVYNNYALMGPSASNGTPYRAGRGRDYSGGIMIYFKGNYKGNAKDSRPSACLTAANPGSVKTVLNFGSDNNKAGTDYDLSNVTFDEWNNNPASYDNMGGSLNAATLTYMEYPFAAPHAEIMEVVGENGSNNIINYALSDNGMGATRPARDLYDTMVMKEMQLGGTYNRSNIYSLKASLDSSEVAPFFEELEKRTGNDYSAYKTAREWFVKQGEGPTLKGASSSTGSTKPVHWDDYTDVNVNTNSDAANKYASHYTTTFEVGDWWGEYCGAPGQINGKYAAVSRTVADLYPDEWMQSDFPEAAAAIDKYRTDNYSGKSDSDVITWDTAGDGIPDWYKAYRNLNIQTDCSKLVNPNTGYTYLEEYLSLMAGDKEANTYAFSTVENFKVNNISYSAAQVFWNTSVRTSCTIEYGTEPGQYTERKELTYKDEANGLETYHAVVLNRLAADTQYYYKVTATDENGAVTTAYYDANDDINSKMTFKTAPLPEGDLLPNKPVITKLVPYTGQVEVKWSGDMSDEGYEIYYDTEDHGCDYTEYANKIENIGARESSYTITGLADGTRYYFVVAAVNMHGQSPSASASAVPERRFLHYDFTQMTEEEQTEFLEDNFCYDTGGTVSFQKDPDTGKNVLQLLDESSAHGVYTSVKLPLVQDRTFTYEIKMKNLYQKQTDALNNQRNVYLGAAEKNTVQLNFFSDLLFEADKSKAPSDLYSNAFGVTLESASEPISVTDNRFDGTAETGTIWLSDIEAPIGSYIPGRTQGSEFSGEKVLPEGTAYDSSRYKYTTVYGDAKYSNLAETNKATHSVWYYEKGSAQYATYRIVADPENSTVKVYADGKLLSEGKVSDFSNIGKFQIKSRNDGFSWTNIESISVYTGDNELNIPDVPEEPEHESTIIIGSAGGAAGDEVVMPVKIENNHGMTKFNIELSYDDEKLVPIQVVKSEDLPGELNSETRVPGYVTAKWQMNQRAAGYTNDGDLFMVKFKLTADLQKGEGTPLSFSEVRIKDQNNELIGVDKLENVVEKAKWSIKNYKNGKVTIIAPEDAAAVSQPRVYIARHENDDVLVDFEIIDVPVVNGQTEYEIQTEKNLKAWSGTTLKIMIWNGNMQPLCNAKTEEYKRPEAPYYGYIINGTVNEDSFGARSTQLQILKQDGTVSAYDFAESFLIENANDVIQKAMEEDSDELVYRGEMCSAETEREVVNSIVGKLVMFGDEDGVISKITLASEHYYDFDITLALQSVDNSNNSEYDEKQMHFKCNRRLYDVKDDTIVFYIGGAGDNFAYGQIPSGYDTSKLKVVRGVDFASVSGVSSAVYLNENLGEFVDVIVIYNAEPGTRTEYPSQIVDNTPALACVKGVKHQTVDGKEVLAVDYMQEGELRTAVTSSADICKDLNKDTLEGSVFMFEVSDGVITSATPQLIFDGTVREKLTANESGIPKVKKLGTAASSDYDIYFGAAIKKRDNRITVVPMNENNLPSLYDSETISLSDDLTVYRYNPEANAGERVSAGTISDVKVDKILSSDYGLENSLYIIGMDGLELDTPAWGMLDYVFIKKSVKKTEIVDYAAYEYYWDYGYR